MVDFSCIPNVRWTEFKNEIHASWRRLRDTEIEATGGDPTALRRLIARRYDLSEEDVGQQLDGVIAAFRRDDHLEGAEENLQSERLFRDRFRQF